VTFGVADGFGELVGFCAHAKADAQNINAMLKIKFFISIKPLCYEIHLFSTTDKPEINIDFILIYPRLILT